jgi:hypothetical protein
LKTGTIFEESPFGLDKWLTALWQIVNCKNGISSYDVSAQEYWRPRQYPESQGLMPTPPTGDMA